MSLVSCWDIASLSPCRCLPCFVSLAISEYSISCAGDSRPVEELPILIILTTSRSMTVQESPALPQDSKMCSWSLKISDSVTSSAPSKAECVGPLIPCSLTGLCCVVLCCVVLCWHSKQRDATGSMGVAQTITFCSGTLLFSARPIRCLVLGSFAVWRLIMERSTNSLCGSPILIAEWHSQEPYYRRQSFHSLRSSPITDKQLLVLPIDHVSRILGRRTSQHIHFSWNMQGPPSR